MRYERVDVMRQRVNNRQAKKVYGKSRLFCVYYPSKVQCLNFQTLLRNVGVRSPNIRNLNHRSFARLRDFQLREGGLINYTHNGMQSGK